MVMIVNNSCAYVIGLSQELYNGYSKVDNFPMWEI